LRIIEDGLPKETIVTRSSRRGFLKTAGMAGAGLLGSSAPSSASEAGSTLSEDRYGVLVDTTVCIGCRQCEHACRVAHDLPGPPGEAYEDRSVFQRKRRPDDTALTVVNEYANPSNADSPYTVKVQCMHCDHPACVSACIVHALTKREDGSVVWDTSKCIGCRYCMVACPFQIPAFEFDDALKPDICKCDFCADRTGEGKLPACVEICPVEALTYGKRYELVKLAHRRIADEPDRYVDHVYGEHEVGGTSWLYLAARPFAEMDFPVLGDSPAPGVSESIQHGLFKYFIPPVLFYALLGGFMWASRERDGKEAE
jgi:Fe-S-cluster-containing dehydrogenase component